MRTSTALWGAIALTGVFALGCAGSETGNGARDQEKRPVTVEMHLESPGSINLDMFDRDGTRFVVATALMSVDQLELLLPEGRTCEELPSEVPPYLASCTAGGERVHIDGPWTVDLVSGAFEPPLELLEVPDGVYERIELMIRPGEAGLARIEDGGELDGASLDVTGTMQMESALAPSGEIELDFGLTLDTMVFSRFGDGPITIGESDTMLDLRLDMRPWLADLALGDCIARGYVPRSLEVLRLEQADRKACGDIAHSLRQALSTPGAVRVTKSHR